MDNLIHVFNGKIKTKIVFFSGYLQQNPISQVVYPLRH
jgi:hypothetical protein